MNTQIDKAKIVNFFNTICDKYDLNNHQNSETLRTILEYADVEKKDVLDIACGPGVLFETYHGLNINSLTAIDISEKMIEKCQSKFPNYDIKYHCMDVEEMVFENQFDSAVIFNAFPHIVNPEELVKKVSLALRDNGTFTIAHGSSRKDIDACHENIPSYLSRKLWSLDRIVALMSSYFEVETAIDNDHMIVITGRKK